MSKKNSTSNGEVNKKDAEEAETYTHLGGGAHLENSSGNVIDSQDIVPPDKHEKGNGEQKSK
ncbi:MAG: competence protein ComE [Iphinoe sp. HA4291-MV1]|jgi:hypothetical protein|nr:competence protein ComE [Iphinoe sp. HA4291-MV1]